MCVHKKNTCMHADVYNIIKIKYAAFDDQSNEKLLIVYKVYKNYSFTPINCAPMKKYLPAHWIQLGILYLFSASVTRYVSLNLEIQR